MAMTQSNEMTLSREVAEAARESEWKGAGFLRELFLGKLRLDLIHPYPLNGPERPEFQRFYADFEQFLREKVDPARIDETGEYPSEVIDGLRKLGAFGMKIPAEYGGLGMNQVEYGKAMQLVGGYDANLTALLSAHQSIRCPPAAEALRVARPSRSSPTDREGRDRAFALTEVHVGSDRPPLDELRALARRQLRHQRLEALVHQRHDRRAPRGHGEEPEDERHQRVRGRGGLGRRGGHAPLRSWACAPSRTRRSASRT